MHSIDILGILIVINDPRICNIRLYRSGNFRYAWRYLVYLVWTKVHKKRTLTFELLFLVIHFCVRFIEMA